jgi:hypothetical protein
MKNRIRLALWLVSLLQVLLSASAMQAQQCSAETTVGNYRVICDGYLPPAANAPMVPAKGLDVATADKNGTFNGVGTISVGGVVLAQTVTGTEHINPDCTGTITFTQTLNGQSAPPIDITFLVSEDGDRINGLVVDPGTVFACELRRTSHRRRDEAK